MLKGGGPPAGGGGIVSVAAKGTVFAGGGIAFPVLASSATGEMATWSTVGNELTRHFTSLPPLLKGGGPPAGGGGIVSVAAV